MSRAQEALTEHPTVIPDLKVTFQQRISSLQRDLRQQIDITLAPCYGRFPLACMIGPPVFMDVTTNCAFKIADDAPEVVCATAITCLAQTVF